ncbi:MAG: Xaa-Pro peptidase family protein [Halofilum sp. (in: g-proteobacteria)]|nr:Xaa-Pro peptidase family protein [Halofilum sp. (in: g-proteobacteria)]
MLELTRQHTAALQQRMQDLGVDLAILTDDDSIAYFGGFWGYLGVEFGRPTLLLIPRDGAPTVITPLMEAEMVAAMTWVEDVRPWEDAGERRWERVLRQFLEALPAGTRFGWEPWRTPHAVAAVVGEHFDRAGVADLEPTIAKLRMIKSEAEIAIMRRAGEIAAAMMQATRDSLGVGVPEYELAQAALTAGTRTAAGFLTERGHEALISPTIHGLPILQSGSDTARVHRRATVRAVRHGDPVYLCCCNLVRFKQYRLGFDREFFVGTASDEMVRAYEVTVAAQQAALAAMRPGVPAEDVHLAAEAVYRDAGFAPGYRTGRAIGISELEAPELKTGDRTPLAAGMTFAVDGGISVPGRFGTRIGDSVVVTADGFDYLTEFPRGLTVVADSG